MSTNSEWQELLRKLLAAPTVAPRGLKTKELIGWQTTIDMKSPYITVAERNIGNKFRYAEAAWILSGDNRVATIKPYSKIIETFSDDGIRFFGAYGPKVVDQLSYVIQTLHSDSNSRQAVINIWREKPSQSKDIPCTCSLQFLIREDILYCIATMRSSDAWLGWVYDIFNFSCISNYIKIQLKHQFKKTIELGTLTLNAGSQHLYKQHWSRAQDCLGSKSKGSTKLNSGYKTGQDFVNHLWEQANG